MNEDQRISKAGDIIGRLRKPTFVFNMATGDKRSPTGQHKRLLGAADQIIDLVERDEYHTMEELYHYRMLYHAHAVRGWRMLGHSVGKSWKHSDGELCFGGGWFVVWADIEGVGQITNHYRAEHWDLFHVGEEMPPEYDGHTPAEAADRLAAMLGDMPGG